MHAPVTPKAKSPAAGKASTPIRKVYAKARAPATPLLEVSKTMADQAEAQHHGMQQDLANLMEQRDELRKSRAKLQRELRNAGRRKTRLLAKASALSNDDLLLVLSMRQDHRNAVDHLGALGQSGMEDRGAPPAPSDPAASSGLGAMPGSSASAAAEEAAPGGATGLSIADEASNSDGDAMAESG